MGDGKLFVKTRSSELRAELEQAYKKSKPHAKIKLVLKKVTANIILNNTEIFKLLPDIISLLRFDDIEIRRVCLDYLCHYAMYDAEASSKAVPFLRRFGDDSDPILRGLTIKTITYIQLVEFVELSFQVIQSYLKDKSSYVRIAATYSVARLFQNHSSRVINDQLLAKLKDLLYDDDHAVVSASLSALDDIIELDKSLDLKLNVNQLHSVELMKYLHKTTEWSQCYVLNSLISFVPETSDTAVDMIELTLPFLQHENSSIVLNAIKVIIYFCNYVNNPEFILPTLPKRLGSSLASLLSKPPEIQFLVLRNIILLLLGRKQLVQFDVEMLFCKYDDTLYVKDTKLEVIYLLANDSNFLVVARELEEYATDVDLAMARKAIRAFGNLAIKIPGAAALCVEIIVDLISNGVSYIVQESAVVLKNIVRKYPKQFDYAIVELIEYYKVIDESDSKVAIIWLVGQYCESINDSQKILKDLCKSYKDEFLDVQYAILTATIKMYLTYSTTYDSMTLEVLKWATENVNNADLRERGYFYWRLISSKSENGEFQALAKKVVFNSNPKINSENDNIDSNVLEELELNIGTLASIYLKPVTLVFRLSKPKKLAPSPALQSRPRKDETYLYEPEDLEDSFDDSNNIYQSKNNTLSTDTLNRRKSLLRRVSHDSGFSKLSDDTTDNRFSGLANRISRKASIMTGKKR